jgi:hypothetical protein
MFEENGLVKKKCAKLHVVANVVKHGPQNHPDQKTLFIL